MAIEKYYDISQVPYERKSQERVLTGFNDLDYYIKGLGIGVTLLVANTSAGKSTLVQGLLARAVEQGYKCWNFAGEHTEQSFLQLIYHQNSQKSDYEPIAYKDKNGNDTNIVDWYVNERREKELREIYGSKIFIYSNKAKRDIESIIESMKDCYEEQGARFFIIDNMISIDNISSNVFAEQTRITEAIRTFALNNKVIVLLVAHQRKIAEKGFLIDIQDVAGSQNISNKAYNVIAQYRTDMLNKSSKDYEIMTRELAKCGFDIEQCDGILAVIKTKGNGNGYVGIKYDPDTKTYRQAPKISQTQADKIFKAAKRKVELVAFDDDEEIPFE